MGRGPGGSLKFFFGPKFGLKIRALATPPLELFICFAITRECFQRCPQQKSNSKVKCIARNFNKSNKILKRMQKMSPILVS